MSDDGRAYQPGGAPPSAGRLGGWRLEPGELIWARNDAAHTWRGRPRRHRDDEVGDGDDDGDEPGERRRASAENKGRHGAASRSCEDTRERTALERTTCETDSGEDGPVDSHVRTTATANGGPSPQHSVSLQQRRCSSSSWVGCAVQSLPHLVRQPPGTISRTPDPPHSTQTQSPQHHHQPAISCQSPPWCAAHEPKTCTAAARLDGQHTRQGRLLWTARRGAAVRERRRTSNVLRRPSHSVQTFDLEGLGTSCARMTSVPPFRARNASTQYCSAYGTPPGTQPPFAVRRADHPSEHASASTPEPPAPIEPTAAPHSGRPAARGGTPGSSVGIPVPGETLFNATVQAVVLLVTDGLGSAVPPRAAIVGHTHLRVRGSRSAGTGAIAIAIADASTPCIVPLRRGGVRGPQPRMRISNRNSQLRSSKRRRRSVW
ncbi:uncharacterized protein BXZ73DRAFT_73250 [Epithele typhae]|uniref:uncharacterized protein n=1 Tax=Epithele typhae TaxID=378194 RepID=UPI0020083191|nr:uncharacterized protein BXZ73DRAFT_73250 [Epithele typhae]KAH9945021.1 hypothetical protein BXZ73DRAFT_73250 [Epithele typhae]